MLNNRPHLIQTRLLIIRKFIFIWGLFSLITTPLRSFADVEPATSQALPYKAAGEPTGLPQLLSADHPDCSSPQAPFTNITSQLIQSRSCTLNSMNVPVTTPQNPESSWEEQDEDYCWVFGLCDHNPPTDLSEYEWDDSEGAGCSVASPAIPGPYHSGDLIHRWYEPLITHPSLTKKDYPPVFDQRRKKALVVIHGWQGFDKSTFRQKRRLLHNAKEDIVSAGSLLLHKKGLDLSFTFVTGTPYGDDLGVLLQCMASSQPSLAQKEISVEDFLASEGVKNCNISDSYQVGWWDWSATSWNRRLKDVERSIWDPQSKKYIEDEHLLSLYKQMVADLSPGTQLTIVGHSLGAALALRLHKVVAHGALEGKLSSHELALSRIILADPYYSNFGLLPFDTSYWPGRRARHTLEEAELAWTKLRLKTQDPKIKDQFIAVDIYATRQDGTEFFSDANRPLKFDSDMSVYVDLVVKKAISQNLTFTRRKFPHPLLMTLDNQVARFVSVAKRKHLYPLYWVMDTLARSTLPSICNASKERPSHHTEESQEAASKKRDHSRAISAGSTVKDISRIWRAGRGHAWYQQVAGSDTLKPEDDEFCYQLHGR